MSIATAELPSVDELRFASLPVDKFTNEIELSVPGMHCGSCMSRIEKELTKIDGVTSVRVNLTLKRVTVGWRNSTAPDLITGSLAAMGFSSTLPVNQSRAKDTVLNNYLRAMAVSGFAAANIMLLSVAVWSGADNITSQLFHWVSAFIAIPAVMYSGRVFFRSAWFAVKSAKTNMDVPISIGIILTCLLSLYDTFTHRESVYFEAATMLVFFLLIGRTLDHLMRRRAMSVVDSLKTLEPLGVNKRQSDGSLKFTATQDLLPGDIVFIDRQGRAPVDSVVVEGVSTINTELIDGESVPHTIRINEPLLAGTLNITAPLTVKVTATAENSFVASIQKLVQYGEGKKGAYRQLADRMAAFYAPIVHAAALLAFLYWLLKNNDLHQAVSVAVAVLIITCPCALALAIPMVQTIAAQRLLHEGVVMKNGAALEKLKRVNTILFDKTGVLTGSLPEMCDTSRYDHQSMHMAAKLAEVSEHPFARAIVSHTADIVENTLTNDLVSKLVDITEVPGSGIEARSDTDVIRLGKRSWAAGKNSRSSVRGSGDSECVLGINGKQVAEFVFSNRLRTDAIEAIEQLHRLVSHIAIVSGDKSTPVNLLAARLNILDAQACCTPEDKFQLVEKYLARESTVLMVGDGLNDSPAMARATVAMAPGCASSVSRTVADFVFLRSSLKSVPLTVKISKDSAKLVKQNFAIAIIYNLIALPFAFSGLVTPLIAALAMSTSSLLVVANSMRLSGSLLKLSDKKTPRQPVLSV